MENKIAITLDEINAIDSYNLDLSKSSYISFIHEGDIDNLSCLAQESSVMETLARNHLALAR